MRFTRRRFLAAMGAAACGSTPPEQRGVDEIRLVRNAWIGSAINVAIAEYLLRDEMGLKVRVLDLNEATQWEPLARGEAHACLEVWQGDPADPFWAYFDSGRVEDAGPLGPVGKAGWYVPSYLLDTFPQLATWEGLTSPEVIEALRSSETGEAGRFVGGDPTWKVHDEDIIRNLKLDLRVVYTGSELALLEELKRNYVRKSPMLFYFWFPHWAHGLYDLSSVELPRYNTRCYETLTAGGIDCDYPPERLFKAVWPGLRLRSPRAYTFFKRFKLSATQQVSLAAAAQLGRRTVEGAAREWIRDNAAIWSTWMDAP
jgi:glycine betaine/proline transport system substrate-binding protein